MCAASSTSHTRNRDAATAIAHNTTTHGAVFAFRSDVSRIITRTLRARQGRNSKPHLGSKHLPRVELLHAAPGRLGADDSQRVVRDVLRGNGSNADNELLLIPAIELDLVVARRRRRKQEPVATRDARENGVGRAGGADGRRRFGKREVEEATPRRRLPAVGEQIRRLRFRVGEASAAARDRSRLAVKRELQRVDVVDKGVDVSPPEEAGRRLHFREDAIAGAEEGKEEELVL